MRGQADFGQMQQAVHGQLRPVGSAGLVYAVEALEDPGRPGFRVDKLPLGFTVSAGDIV